MAYTFEENMEFALTHELKIREKVGRSSVLPASVMVDRTMGTDLLILGDAYGSGCAARVRRAPEYEKWEFTIRITNSHGHKTEYEKFREGMCRWYFYGTLNKQETDFTSWMLMDLDAWRRAEDRRDQRCKDKKEYPIYGKTLPAPGGNWFAVYKATSRRLAGQPNFMVDCSDYSYPGHVKIRHYERQKYDAKRFLKRAA